MIGGGWAAGALGIHIHSYDLVPVTLGLEIYRAYQGRNGYYEVDNPGTLEEDSLYPYFDDTGTQLVPSLLIGNHWQSIAVGATWIGIERERPLFMPTVQWRNLRIAANLADEGYATAQYHLPLDQRARNTRERVAALREDGVSREYLVENATWTRVFGRYVFSTGLMSSPELDYGNPEERSKTVRISRHNGTAAGLELNRTFFRRFDLGVGLEFSTFPYSGMIEVRDRENDWTDHYGYRDTIGGYFRVAGYAGERFWGYGRFGMSVTEIRQEDPSNTNAEVGFPEIPNYGYFPHWWTDLGVGFGFLRNRQFGIDLEAGPRFSYLVLSDVFEDTDLASIGFGVQASVRRNAAPRPKRVRTTDGILDPTARILGKPMWMRFAFGGITDPFVDVTVSEPVTSIGSVDRIVHRDNSLLASVEAAVNVTDYHSLGLRFQTHFFDPFAIPGFQEIEINEDGPDPHYEEETTTVVPYNLFLFHKLQWRALGFRTEAGISVTHITNVNTEVEREIFDDTRTFLTWSVGAGPTVRLARFGIDDRNEIDLGVLYRYEWIDLEETFGTTISNFSVQVELGYIRRFGGR